MCHVQHINNDDNYGQRGLNDDTQDQIGHNDENHGRSGHNDDTHDHVLGRGAHCLGVSSRHLAEGPWIRIRHRGQCSFLFRISYFISNIA